MAGDIKELVNALFEAGLRVAHVSGYRARRYARAKGLLAKTDPLITSNSLDLQDSFCTLCWAAYFWRVPKLNNPNFFNFVTRHLDKSDSLHVGIISSFGSKQKTWGISIYIPHLSFWMSCGTFIEVFVTANTS